MPVRYDVPLSGLRAGQQEVAASAHNTANASTRGFERQRIALRERPGGGVETRVDTVELSAGARRAARSADSVRNRVDQAGEAVVRIEGREAVRRNARVIRTQDRMLKTLLDVRA